MTTMLAAPRSVQPPRPLAERMPQPSRSPERIAAGLTVAALIAVSIAAVGEVGISVPDMIASWSNAERFFARVGAPTFPEFAELMRHVGLTLGLVLTGTVLAALLSIPVAYFAAANTSPHPSLRAAARFASVLTRAVPDAVLAMAFVLIFSLGTLPGILAIGIHSIGMISKLFADAIEQIDNGPRLAIRAAGGSRVQEFFSGILPQVMPSWIATVLHRNDINLRGSVILGYVGVAGLGQEMSQAFKSLQYDRGIGIAIIVFALCMLMEIVSSSVRATMLGHRAHRRTWADRLTSRLRGRQPLAPRAPRSVATPREALRRPWTAERVRNVTAGWIAAAVVIAGVWVCNITWSDALTVWAKIPEMVAKFWPPNFGSYGSTVLFDALRETIAIALAATLISVVPSLILASFAARNVAPSRGIRTGARFLLVGIRGVPEVILAIVLIVITGLGMQAGTIALALGGIGLLGKLIADSFEEVATGPERALFATGATRLQVYTGATVPQGTPALLGHTFYLLDTNLRAATILGIVGGGGVGYYLLNASQGANYGLVTMVVLLILGSVLVVEGLAMWMRKVFG